MTEKTGLLSITDLEKVKDRLTVRLCGKEMLEKYPADILRGSFLDMTVIYGISLEAEYGGSACAIVSRRLPEIWGVSPEEVREMAVRSSVALMPPVVEALPDIMSRQFGIDYEENGPGIFLIGNSSMVYGASAVLYPGVLENAAEKLKGSFYLLPSSVHEFLAVPECCGIDPEALKKMVMEINEAVVAPEDRLSDSVYFYDTEENELEVV